MRNSTIKQIRKRWEIEGYNFFIWHDPPNKNWPPIIHPFDEVVILIEGKLVFIVEEKKIQLVLNEEFFVPAEIMHTVHNVGNSTNCWCYGYRIETTVAHTEL